MVQNLKDESQDFEWYPTTDEIINAVACDMKVHACGERYDDRIGSILDIGAGDGRVLTKLKKSAPVADLMAIELSTIHHEAMSAEIMIVGTDFREQQLADKKVDVIFCNPPYSQFEAWAEKIIREASATVVYLVIPARWKSNEVIQGALMFRGVEAKTIGEFDFQNAERVARAYVHVVRIKFSNHKKEAAFDRLFEEQFRELYDAFKQLDVSDEENEEGEDDEEKRVYVPGGRYRPFGKLKNGPSLPDRLVAFYNEESQAIYDNFNAMKSVDASVLRELGVNPLTIMKTLRSRLAEIKAAYWRELFSRIEAITRRLTHESREQLLKKLNGQMNVDFTLSNIYAIIIWVIKNANTYMEQQIIAVYDKMIDAANVVNYKSNHRVFVQNQWRQVGEENSHFALEYRIVTHRVGGVRRSGWYDDGLAESAAKFIGDLCTIACNLGFPCDTVPASLVDREVRKQWAAGEATEFKCKRKGEEVVLFEVRAFLNGNLHFKFNKEFMLALNVEHGRLRGWLHTAKQASEELWNNAAAQFFKSNTQIAYNALNVLTYEH